MAFPLMFLCTTSFFKDEADISEDGKEINREHRIKVHWRSLTEDKIFHISKLMKSITEVELSKLTKMVLLMILKRILNRNSKQFIIKLSQSETIL